MTYTHDPPRGRRGEKAENLYREGMMRKLTLNLESLEVESFQPAEQRQARGTVIGAEMMTRPGNCITVSCGNSEQQPCRWDD